MKLQEIAVLDFSRMLHFSALLLVLVRRELPLNHCTMLVHLVQEITHGLRLVHGHLCPNETRKWGVQD